MDRMSTKATTEVAVHPPKLNGDLGSLCVHMVGIGGSGMSGLAALLLARGARVSGTDLTPSITTNTLMAAGARIGHEHAAAAVPADAALVVASAAVPAEHPELAAARARGVAVLKYAELLGALMATGRGIAISGTHGKSTTTAWLAYVLRAVGRDPSFIVGALSPQLGGGSGVGQSDLFVAEACEYDRSFLNLSPKAAVVLNVDEDHLDCYEHLAAIQGAFGAFAARLPDEGLLLINGDDAPSRGLRAATSAQVETFGLGAGNTWRATDLAATHGRHSFELEHEGVRRGRFALTLAGRHNVNNALAVIALAHWAGVPLDELPEAVGSFAGIGRRLELRAERDGITVVDDYAHHPTEIRATLDAARQRFAPRRLFCVFQPHQHSRTRFLLEDFANSFAAADQVLVPDIYFVRDSVREREAVNASDLVARLHAHNVAAVYMPSFDAIVDHLAAELRAGDVVLTMGAGSIWKVADELVCRL